MGVINKRSVLKEKRGKLTDKKRAKLEVKCGHNDCIYVSALMGGMCDYLEVEGHSRGCPATADCIHYKKGKMRKIRKLEL